MVIGWRSANADYDRIPGLVADLVQSKVDVIVVDTTLATQAVKRATSTIPIVMALVVDPVASGLVASLPHPACSADQTTIDPQGRQARRPADRATNEIRARGQPQDRTFTAAPDEGMR